MLKYIGQYLPSSTKTSSANAQGTAASQPSGSGRRSALLESSEQLKPRSSQGDPVGQFGDEDPTKRQLPPLPPEILRCIAERFKSSPGQPIHALTGMARMAIQNRELRDVIRGENRYLELRCKTKEATRCVDQSPRLNGWGKTGLLQRFWGRDISWNHSDSCLIQLLPFLPTEYRKRILNKAMAVLETLNHSADDWSCCWDRICKYQDLLTKEERDRLITGLLGKGDPAFQLALCTQIKGARDHFSSEKIERLIREADYGRLEIDTAALDNAHLKAILNQALSMNPGRDRDNVIHTLTSAISDLDEDDYKLMVDAAIKSENRIDILFEASTHLDRLSPARRKHLFSLIGSIENEWQRDVATAMLAGGFPHLDVGERNKVFEAVLKTMESYPKQFSLICSFLPLMNVEERTRLFDRLIEIPFDDPLKDHFRRGHIAELAYHVAYLSAAQANTIAGLVIGHSGKQGLGKLIRGRALSSGEQRETLDNLNIVETSLASDPGATAYQLSAAVEVLSAEECLQFANSILSLNIPAWKSHAVAAAGKVLHQLPDDVREALIQAAEGIPSAEGKIEAAVGLSRGMAHLTQDQCQRLLDVARRAHCWRPTEAFIAFLDVEWPFHLRWDRAGAPIEN